MKFDFNGPEPKLLHNYQEEAKTKEEVYKGAMRILNRYQGANVTEHTIKIIKMELSRYLTSLVQSQKYDIPLQNEIKELEKYKVHVCIIEDSCFTFLFKEDCRCGHCGKILRWKEHE